MIPALKKWEFIEKHNCDIVEISAGQSVLFGGKMEDWSLTAKFRPKFKFYLDSLYCMSELNGILVQKPMLDTKWNRQFRTIDDNKNSIW